MGLLRRIVDVRVEERRSTFAAFATLLALTTGHTLLETARDSLFLAKLPASRLPWMYLVIVVVALSLAKLGRLRRRPDSRGALGFSLVAAAAVNFGFFVLTRHAASAPTVLYALYVWTGLFASWAMVEFWTLLGRAYTMTQAKRLYGFIGAGAVVGGVFGALFARAAMMAYGPRAMLLFAAALFLLAALPIAAFRSREAEGVAEEPALETGEGSIVASGRLAWQNAFARRVFLVTLVAVVTVTLVDFVFKARIAEEYADAKQLGVYLSSFYAVTNTLAVVAQLVIAPWIFRTIGVQRALFFFPIALVGGAGVMLATGASLAGAVLMRGLDNTLRYSIHKTSMELLLVAVPDGTRERVKPIIDLLGSRGGQALASVLILFLVAVGSGSPSVVGAVALGLAIVWTALVVTIRSLYLEVFRETLRAGGLSGKAELPELDLAVLETLFAGLNSSRDTEVLASLELLAEQKRGRLIPALILYHPSREVVLRALELFTAQGRDDFTPIADRLNEHPDREVAAAALRARSAVAPDEKLLWRRLEEKCPQVAATALVALMAQGAISPEDAKNRIEKLLAEGSWQTAAELARCIRDVAVGRSENPELDDNLDGLLVRLAEDASTMKALPGDENHRLHRPGGYVPGIPGPTKVRLEVARAMGRRRHPSALPVLLAMLDRHELRATARAALLTIPGAHAFLVEAISRGTLPREIRVHLPRTIGAFPSREAVVALLPLLVADRDGAVRYKILRTLLRLRRADPTSVIEETVLLRAIETTIEHAVELQRWRVALEAESEPVSSAGAPDPLGAAHRLLVDLVRGKEVHAVERLFMLLELIDAEDFEDIPRALRSRNPKTRANSLELVENLVRAELRDQVMALVGDAAPREVPSYAGALEEMVRRGGTLRTLAEYRAIELGIDVAATGGLRLPQPPSAELIGKRLLDKARDLLTERLAGEGNTRASA